MVVFVYHIYNKAMDTHESNQAAFQLAVCPISFLYRGFCLENLTTGSRASVHIGQENRTGTLYPVAAQPGMTFYQPKYSGYD